MIQSQRYDPFWQALSATSLHNPPDAGNGRTSDGYKSHKRATSWHIGLIRCGDRKSDERLVAIKGRWFLHTSRLRNVDDVGNVDGWLG